MLEKDIEKWEPPEITDRNINISATLESILEVFQKSNREFPYAPTVPF